MLRDQHHLCESDPKPASKGSGTWAGHRKAYEGYQRGLRKAIQEALAMGCPVPPEALEWASRPVPQAPSWTMWPE